VEDEAEERVRKGVEDSSVSIFKKNKMTKNNYSPVLLSLEAFDRLEGVEDDILDSDFTEHLTGDAVDISEGKIKVINALHGKKDVWARFGAGRMIQNILTNGLRLNFGGKLPSQYQEANNKSFINNEEFGVSQVLKLLENQVIEEVSPTDLQCINPLSIASNRKGKQRLCLDLSRWVNEAVVAKKFRIESISDFMKAVKQGSWAFYYDLRSAFHHIRVNIKHRKYLGVCIRVEDQDRYYRFVGMPFGYRDASRILTKLMRTPLTMMTVCALNLLWRRLRWLPSRSGRTSRSWA
jgi:hypothetical protein